MAKMRVYLTKHDSQDNLYYIGGIKQILLDIYYGN